MIIKFAKAFGNWKVGDITDVADTIGRALIDAGEATQSNEAEQLRALMLAETERTRTETLELVRSTLQGVKTATPAGPPTGGGTVDFQKLSATSVPAEEQDKDLKLTDALRCIFLVEARNVPEEVHEYARKRLRNYTDGFTEYSVDPSSGKLVTYQQRQLADGGLETIKRTGSDSVSGGPTYGFTLKPTFLAPLFRIAREASVFADACRPVPVSDGNEAIWPALDQFNAPVTLNGIMQSAVFGGITMSYLGETTQRVQSDAKTRENRYKVMDLTGMTNFSRDYIVDNYIAMDSEVVRLFGEAVGWLKDWTYINGDGIGAPQGFLNANATLTTGPNSGARYTTNTIYSDDLVYLLSRMHTSCWMKSRWIANVTTLTQIWALLNKAGNAIFQPNALISQDMLLSIMGGSRVDEGKLVSMPMGLLLGRPIYFTEKLPALGTSGDICLVDPYQYGDAVKAGLEVGVSEHFYFDTDRIAYRFKYRHFGKSLWPAAYTQADNTGTPGSGTQVSPFLALHS